MDTDTAKISEWIKDDSGKKFVRTNKLLAAPMLSLKNFISMVPNIANMFARLKFLTNVLAPTNANKFIVSTKFYLPLRVGT